MTKVNAKLIHDRAKEFIDWNFKNDNWEDPPVLISMSSQGRVSLYPFIGMHPTLFLGMVAEGKVDNQINSDVVALALFDESYALRDASPEDIEWMKTHSIADHPKGYEAKNILSFDGRKLRMRIAYRGIDISLAEEFTSSRWSVSPDVGGEVAEAMIAALTHLKARR